MPFSPLDDLGPTSRSYMSQRLRLNYLDWGNSDAPTLILLHGGRDHARSWDWTARALREDWHVIAPDLRGHGDSSWSPDGSYDIHDFVYDFAQLVHQLGDEPLTIVAHSMGGAVATHYTATFPETVRRLVTIEGMGRPPAEVEMLAQKPMPELWRQWVLDRRGISRRSPRRYSRIEDALERMREANQHLSEERLRHLTLHGLNRNEDGSFSWKYDNMFFSQIPLQESEADMAAIWNNISCPVLLCHGSNSWASDPVKDGRFVHFRNAQMVYFEQSGHWLHHDEFDKFVSVVSDFIKMD